MVGGANKKANSRETRKESQLKINESSSTRGEAGIRTICKTLWSDGGVELIFWICLFLR